MANPLWLLAFIFLPSVLGIGQAPTISFTNGALQLAGSSAPATILVSSDDWPGVSRAATDLSRDFGRVTGKNLTIAASAASGPAIIVGTIGKSKLIDSLISSGKIEVSKINGKWESFQSQVVANPVSGVEKALVV